MAAKQIPKMANERIPSKSRSELGSRAVKLVLSSWSLLETSEHRPLRQKTIASYCGLTETALSNWTVGDTELSQLEALLKLLERLPEAGRVSLISSVLRVYPTLESPVLAHDPLAVDRLRSLLKRTRGVAFIQGERDYARSYLWSALGDAAARVGSSLRPIAGLDFHADSALVPVPGVVYLGDPPDQAELRQRVRASWPPDASGHLVMLNRVWLELPQFQSEILAMAEARHVILADNTHFDSSSLRRTLGAAKIPALLLSVSELPGDRIAVSFAEA
jgi:hypothetical protein